MSVCSYIMITKEKGKHDLLTLLNLVNLMLWFIILFHVVTDRISIPMYIITDDNYRQVYSARLHTVNKGFMFYTIFKI